jgi:hypothetical protein
MEPAQQQGKPKRIRRKKQGADTPKSPDFPVQFGLSAEDNDDFNELVGPLKTRTTVALMLFLYGLDNSADAFAHYARHHEQARKRRLEAKAAEQPSTPGDPRPNRDPTSTA